MINLSLEFSAGVRSSDVPDVIAALRYARHRGVAVVAASGNSGEEAPVSLPARGPGVIAVGATSHRGCQAEYSNAGRDLDVVAPGGGEDASLAFLQGDPWTGASASPTQSGRWIYQQTFTSSVRRFGLPRGVRGDVHGRRSRERHRGPDPVHPAPRPAQAKPGGGGAAPRSGPRATSGPPGSTSATGTGW